MRCPYCLTTHKIFDVDSNTGGYECPNCKTGIPRTYVESRHLPRSTVGVVGFSGHGKTVFLTSLFSSLGKFSNYWSDYYFRSLDDFTHRILYQQVRDFEKGELPESTPANFPNPALIQYNEIPDYGSSFVSFYDTAGEVFNDVEQITRTGFFVAHSDTVLFIISISDCEQGRLDDEMSRLLDTYIRAAMDRLNVEIRDHQRIVVIFSKADLLDEHLSSNLKEWLYKGDYAWYALNLEQKALDISLSSIAIEEWLLNDLRCSRFVNMLKDHFKEVRYTLLSATGAVGEDEDHHMVGAPEPLRVLDPFFWILQFSSKSEVEEKEGIIQRIKKYIEERKGNKEKKKRQKLLGK